MKPGQTRTIIREKLPFNHIYVLFIQGDESGEPVPVSITQSPDDTATVLQQLKDGVHLPEDVKVSIKPIHQCSDAELERLKLTCDLRAYAINFAQVATMVRAQASGIVMPGSTDPSKLQ